jgi:phosphoglycolate phosphatase
LAEAPFDSGLIRVLKNSAINLEELDIISKAIMNMETVEGIGLFRTEPCDANLLGFISDIGQQVVSLRCCIVYCPQPHGVKLSVRSSVREIMASEIAVFLCRGAGNGGGTMDKAGGFITFKGIRDTAGEQSPEEFLRDRVTAYTGYYDHIYAGDNDIDFNAMARYKKLPLTVGFVKSNDVFPSGTKVTVRTLEGDIDTRTDDDLYLMIGIQGEVYPIRKERFNASYTVSEIPYAPSLEYIPVLLNRNTGERKELMVYAHSCVPSVDKIILAKPLEKATKVFTHWDTDKYFSGAAGDWLAANEDDFNDCYIIREDIFLKTYAALCG